MKHCNYMRSFRQIQEDMKKSYGVEDIKKGTANNPTVVGEEFDIFKPKQTGNTVFVNNKDDISALESVNDINSSVIEQTFNAKNPIFEEKIRPRYEMYEKRPQSIYISEDQPVTSPVKPSLKDISALNNFIGEKISNKYKNKTKIDSFETKKQQKEWEERKKTFDEFVNLLFQQSVYGLHQLKGCLRNGQLLTPALEVDTVAENSDPEIQRKVRDRLIFGQDVRDKILRGITRFKSRKGRQYDVVDTVSDMNQIINGLDRLHNNEVKSIDKVMPFIEYDRGEVNAKDGTFEISYFSSGSDPRINISPDNDRLNSYIYSGHSVRFHEFLHAVTEARRKLEGRGLYSNPEPAAHDDKTLIYPEDRNAYNGLLKMSDLEITQNKEAYFEWANMVMDSDMKRSTINALLGELVVNCRLLRAISEGDEEDIEKIRSHGNRKDYTYLPSHILGHDVDRKYYTGYKRVENIVGIIVNETFSNMIELHLNGDLYNPLATKLVGKFISAYYEHLDRFLELTPEEFDSDDFKTLRKNLFNVAIRDRGFLTWYYRKYGIPCPFKKSESFREILERKKRR